MNLYTSPCAQMQYSLTSKKIRTRGECGALHDCKGQYMYEMAALRSYSIFRIQITQKGCHQYHHHAQMHCSLESGLYPALTISGGGFSVGKPIISQ